MFEKVLDMPPNIQVPLNIDLMHIAKKDPYYCVVDFHRKLRLECFGQIFCFFQPRNSNVVFPFFFFVVAKFNIVTPKIQYQQHCTLLDQSDYRYFAR